MKLHAFRIMVIFSIFSLITSCDLLNKKDNEESSQQAQDFSLQVTTLNSTLEDFVVKAQAYENAKFSTLKVAQIKQITDDYLTAGAKFVAAMEKIQTTQNQNKSLHLKSGTPIPCSPMDFIPDAGSGISPGLVKNVADLINETKGDVDAIQKKFDNNEIDENTYIEARNKLKINKGLKTACVGLGAFVGAGAAYGAGSVLVATTLPAIATVTVIGVVVGTSVTWLANWYTVFF